MFDVVFSYTRTQAIADGVLVDISAHAMQVGIVLPMAITSAVYETCCNWGGASERDISDRINRIALTARLAIGNIPANEHTTSLALKVKGKLDDSDEIESIPLKLEIHGGDDCEPVLTLMLPHED